MRQAPTPTRFVGRMHAVVSGRPQTSGSGGGRGGGGDSADSFSRRSSIVSRTIHENDDDKGDDSESAIERNSIASSQVRSHSATYSAQVTMYTMSSDLQHVVISATYYYFS